MKMFILTFAFFAVSACTTSRNTYMSISQQYTDEVTRLEELRDKYIIQDRDPYVLDEFSASEFRDKFAEEICHLSKNKKKRTQKQLDTCTELLWKSIVARIGETYPFTDGAGVMQKCNAYPIKCKEGRNFENWVRQSHNDSVNKLHEESIAKLDESYDSAVDQQQYYEQQAQAQRNAAWGSALQRMGEAFNPPNQVIEIRNR